MQITFLEKLMVIIILRKKQSCIERYKFSERLITYFNVKKSVSFVNKLKTLKNTMRFSLLIILQLKLWSYNQNPYI